jgi:KDO2-lipid IV(A) lauroyltransferase
MSDRTPLYRYWAPRYWPAWMGMAVLRVICLLPHQTALAIGRVLGRLAERATSKRRAIVRRNIELCFPELSATDRDALGTRHFEALGMSLVEMGIGRWASDATHLKLARLEGLEHLQQALEAGKGVILLSAHFTTLEISGRVLAISSPPFDAVFRKNSSEFIKKMVRNLRKGRAVWYAPDQSYNRKGSEVIPFFGVPSMHTTATSMLARLGDAVTLPFFPRRLDDGSYVHRILPPLDDFPSDDAIEDTKKYVRVLEEHIRSCPEQYFWLHRKFKNLPEGHIDYYADLDALK